jgi:phage shock protein PspC (stress-responsive transcriptional regulator)
MQKLTQVTLSGHASAFPLDEKAVSALQAYLDRAQARLAGSPDRDEVLRDLEQSIGDKLFAQMAGAGGVIQREAVLGVLEQIGNVEPVGAAALPFDAHLAPPPGRRRLCRIQEGQAFVGVCQGLSAYTSIRVDWVRSLFVILSVFTAGVPALIYLVLAFVLPVVHTQADYVASLENA